jgi:hypothetical protein
MIPPRSTPIKNEVLIEIFAKGKLTQTEMRITAYIIRNSWGYSFNGIRQQWTKPLTITQIAKDIELSRCKCSTAINGMLKEKKIIRKNNQYKFNEHYEEWVLPNSNGSVVKSKQCLKSKHPEQPEVLPDSNSVTISEQSKVLPNRNSVTKREHLGVLPNRNSSVTKSEHKCYQNVTAVLPHSNTQPQANQDENKLISTPKETIKENIKETIKENTTAPNEKLKLNNEKMLNEKPETESEKLKTNNETLKPESKALKAKTKKEKITFNSVSGRFAHLDEIFLKRLRETFPRANIEMEIRKAELWLYANPAKRKSNYERFLINWLSRAEKGGSSGKSDRYIAISEEDYNPNGKPFSARAGEW